jgi:hypothetical protein
VIAALLPATATVTGTTDAVESAGIGRRMAAEIGRGTGLGPMMARRVPAMRRRPGAVTEDTPDVVVASSGNLAHVYVTSLPGQATAEAIERSCPGLIEGLRRQPGIGALVVRSPDGAAQVLGPRGRVDLGTGHVDGVDPLDDYGPAAAEAVRRLASFPTSGDLMLLGAIDRVTGEVTALEGLIGSHGGLGGWQTEPFILVPADLSLTGAPLVGAPSVHRELVAWQRAAASVSPVA